MKPHEFLSLLKKRSEIQSIEQRCEAFLEKCCDENSEIDLDIRTFDITDDFSQQDRDSAINELCELFNRPELILKRSPKCSDSSTTVDAALGTFRNLTDDLRAEDTNFDTCQTTSNIEVLLKKCSSDGYVLLKADDDGLSGGNDLSLVFQTSYTIVQRDDARNAKIFADNFPRAAKLEPFGRRLINLEEDIRKTRLNFETQTLRSYKVDESTPNEMAIIRDQLRQQLAGSLQDQFFSLSLKRKLLNIIDEIVNFSQRGDSEAASVKTESLAPVKHKQLPAPDSDSSLSSSIEAKCARATYRSIPRGKERFRQSLEFCGQSCQIKLLIALFQFCHHRQKWA
jgi:hypothetical protein